MRILTFQKKCGIPKQRGTCLVRFSKSVDVAALVFCLSLSRTSTNLSDFRKQLPRIGISSSAPGRLARVLLPWCSPDVYLQQPWKFRCQPGESGIMAQWGTGLMATCRTAAIVALVSWALLFPCTPVIAAEDDQPEDFEYYQIWASQDGETHFAECKMKGFNLTVYSSLPQYVRSDFGGAPIGVVLTELAVGLAQPLHSAPQVQLVATLSGSWYIETSDGTRHEFKKGELLFQDDIVTSPANKQPQHYSGTAGDDPCQQLIVQLSRPPQVDNPCPF